MVNSVIQFKTASLNLNTSSFILHFIVEQSVFYCRTICILETFVNVLITHVQDLKAFCVVVSMLSFNNFLNAFHEMVAHRHTFFT
jgi:hypothetical protein